MGNSPVDSKREEIILETEDPAFREKVYQHACRLTGNTTDAEKYMQEALTRFVSMVKNKTSLKELERIHPLPYVFKILGNIHRDRRS